MASSQALARLPEGALFLGLDCSTQSFKATAIDSNLRTIARESVNFDSDLPHFATRGGVHYDRIAPGTISSPVHLWLEALELLFGKLQSSDFPFGRVVAVSGSGQQHGSVYWRKGAREDLKYKVGSGESIAIQLRDSFASGDCLVWMDSSTGDQCRAIEKEVGGALEVSRLTGSRAYERFTGPQIRKVYESRREVYEECERISLVSSFMASILIGDYASIDHSDGAGMNLMDLRLCSWSDAALQATAPGLKEKLGPLASSHGVAGNIHPFFVNKYNFAQDCLVIQWSGDNPCSLAGLALEHPGDIAISLGTSDTVFGVTQTPQPGVEGHVFPNPVDPGSYMAMLCYKNGSLTREEYRDRYAGGSWDKFNSLLDEAPPLNEGKLVFYYKEHEIIPPLPASSRRFVLGDDNTPTEAASEFSPSQEIRGLVEGQFVSMQAHAKRIGLPIPPNRIISTGGASANDKLLQVMASVFDCSVYKADQTDSASLGAAIRAAHGWVCEKQETGFVPFSSLVEGSAIRFQKVAEPDRGIAYENLAVKRMAIEEQLLNEK